MPATPCPPIRPGTFTIVKVGVAASTFVLYAARPSARPTHIRLESVGVVATAVTACVNGEATLVKVTPVSVLRHRLNVELVGLLQLPAGVPFCVTCQRKTFAPLLGSTAGA